MLPKNTFLMKQTEKWDSENAFISILSPQLLKYINGGFLDKNVIFSSTPGGGKTTLLRTFSPEILNEIQASYQNEENRDIFQMLKSMDALDENHVKVLSITVFCARENYSLIEDVYDDGKSIPIFFALLSLRVIRKAIDALLICHQLDKKDMKKIYFAHIPQEYKVMVGESFTADEIYEWSLKEERELCKAIENMDESINANLQFNNLSVFKLFENGNLIYDHQVINKKIIIMFDDVHALTKRQREHLRNAIFRLRPKAAVWMTERSVALDDDEIFGTEGKIHREYEIINIDRQIHGNRQTFYKALEDVANRRVALIYNGEKLNDRLETGLENIGKSRLNSIIEKIRKKIDPYCSGREKYQNLYEHIEAQTDLDTLTRAKYWRVFQIMIVQQEKKSQYTFDFTPAYGIQDFVKAYKQYQYVAEYYISLEYGLPIYWGMNTLSKLSSGNVEQFLDFAGEIFEYRIALDILPKSRKKKMITALEQENAIKKCADEKWEDILRNFSFGMEVQTFLQGIANIGVENLKMMSASYGGGTYTGIGFRSHEFQKLLEGDKYQRFLLILKSCVANNLLNCQEIRQGDKGEINKVFYLNRWICVKFNLPLDYGGWKPLNAENALELIIRKDK